MKKLKSLSSFNSSKLKEIHTSNVLGGAPSATKTTAGERCTMSTSTGCQGYTSDSISGSTTTYFGTYESGNPCNGND